jgi:hypothetical protein
LLFHPELLLTLASMQVYHLMTKGDLGTTLVKDKKLKGSAAVPFFVWLMRFFFPTGGFATADWSACVMFTLEAAKGVAFSELSNSQVSPHFLAHSFASPVVSAF